MSDVECLRRIFAEPLGYLHPQRLLIPREFEGAEARSLLNRMLLDGLSMPVWLPSVRLTGVAKQWVRHWRQLPFIALLMGAYRLMPELARGAALRCLPASVRRFAGYHLGARGDLPIDRLPISMEQIEAAGLNALWSWHQQVPPWLLERLALQFSEPVVRLHRQWPVPKPVPTLFLLAVQHARLDPIPG
ncbi:MULTISPECIES: secretion system protein [Pseudomonas]|uniref:secretion system protein n=1 Tax=Pseudomonas TaxID=286 RepID=UPI001BE59B2F|nr:MULTISPECIES: secretion system protein [Pseudomonas]MBT2339695.1 secretion system protein [Pseudomonas fluorescens]MCD4531217.1 secretion system protein [Pseudomonas sp. C3-2018]